MSESPILRLPGPVLVMALLLGALVLVAPAAAAPGGREPAARQQEPEPAAQSQEGEGQAAKEEGNGGGNDPGSARTAEDYELPPQWAGEKKVAAAAVRQPPVIDGDLSDAAWSQADAISDFLQREPDNGQPGSERTVVRIVYDDEAIYFGFMLHDSEPDRIAATDLRRDSRLRDDDTIAVLMDTFHDHRNGFLFRVNPLGTKYDALLRDESQVNSDWDEKWEAATRITDEGWVAEIRIPLRVLRYPTGSHVWGVDFKREIRRRNEEDNWSNYGRGYQFNAISQGGALVGLEDLSLTDRFRFKPYVTGGGAQFHQIDDPFSEASGDAGVEDFKVQITPNLTADFTVNTDFAQVEDDNERVNLTRFSLFFPEKREFFLESANNFAFGTRRGFRDFGGPQVNLYHSRNIGLESGEAVPILVGAKMTGKLGSTNVGLLNVQTDESEFGPGENYTALRMKQDVLGRSSIGALFTNVQGGADHNRVVGLDGDFTFFDYFSIDGFVARVDDSGLDGNPWAGQIDVGWDSDRWSASGSYMVVQPEFASDLGFITRTDIERQTLDVGWAPRPDVAGIRQLRLNASLEYIADTGGRMLNRDQSLSFNTSFQSGDSVWLFYSRNFERIDFPFTVAGVTIPAGDYSYDSYTMNVNTYGARRVSGRFRVTYTDNWFGGERISWSPGGSIRFGSRFSLSPSYSLNQIELPGGSTDTHTVSLRSAYNFNDRWLTNSLVQYNSVSSAVSVFARLNYIYRTGDDFFLVYKQSYLVDGLFQGESNRSVTAKLTYSFDF